MVESNAPRHFLVNFHRFFTNSRTSAAELPKAYNEREWAAQVQESGHVQQLWFQPSSRSSARGRRDALVREARPSAVPSPRAFSSLDRTSRLKEITLETSTPNSKHTEAVQQVAEAHSLLQTLRTELDQHPGLEEAISKLESALNILSAKSGGLL